MKLFFASACSAATHKQCWKEAGVKHLLFSYGNGEAQFRENKDLYEDESISIVVDSGAYTSWTQGKPIGVQDYIRFCFRVLEGSRARVLFVNLDVIPGSKGVRPTLKQRVESAYEGMKNYRLMQDVGLPVMHVFHQHEDFHWLDTLLEEGNLFGVSPANDVSVAERRTWLRKVLERMSKRQSGSEFPRTHGFGITTQSLLERFPFYQVDSTSWLAASLYGTVPIRTGRGILTLSKREAFERAGRGRVGMQSMRKLVPSCEGYRFCTTESLLAYKDMERWVSDLWRSRGVSWDA